VWQDVVSSKFTSSETFLRIQYHGRRTRRIDYLLLTVQLVIWSCWSPHLPTAARYRAIAHEGLANLPAAAQRAAPHAAQHPATFARPTHPATFARPTRVQRLQSQRNARAEGRLCSCINLRRVLLQLSPVVFTTFAGRFYNFRRSFLQLSPVVFGHKI
jgi:hypothetical protein